MIGGNVRPAMDSGFSMLMPFIHGVLSPQQLAKERAICGCLDDFSEKIHPF
jgi:hypothetical protein